MAEDGWSESGQRESMQHGDMPDGIGTKIPAPLQAACLAIAASQWVLHADACPRGNTAVAHLE